MALLPELFGNDLDDDDFAGPFFPVSSASWRPVIAQNAMSTDIREKDGNYIMDIDLPGFDKSNVHVQLKDGYLVVTAHQDKNESQKDKEGRVIRRERYQGSRSRSFYVGENLRVSDVKANFAHGVLTLTFPKEAPAPQHEEQSVQIEG